MRFCVLFLLATAGAVAPQMAAAIMFCSEPSKPYCLDAYGTFDDQWSFDQCRDEVQSFVDSVNRYVDCLGDEQREKTNDANEAVERFNCRASGNDFCP